MQHRGRYRISTNNGIDLINRKGVDNYTPSA
jgi:hypothetical protein